MSMFDFVKRSNQLMFGAAKESLTDYTRDLSELGNAANQVREKLSSGTRSARDTMNNYKSTGIVSGISNWFYGKEFELGDSDEMLFDNHEFNSGNPEWQDNDSEEAPSPLTNSSMKELVKGQVSSMYKIGSKQTEAGIANTAEIVSTMTKSSAEIIASINNVNSSLIAISGKIDSLVEAIRPPQQSQSGSNDGWFDSNGRFTVRSMMQGLMNPSNLSGSVGMAGSVASILTDPNMRKMFLTPENLISMFVMDPLKNKDFDVLGGHSVDYYGKKFQTMTHNMIEETIEKLIEKTPLGEIIGKEKYRGNLGKVDNQYTKEAAVFDKATRHTIVSIIPEYLKKMTEAITGQKWNINEKGYLTTKEQANPYSRIGNVLHDASLDYEDYKHLSKVAEDKGSKISSSEMDDAQRAWIWVIVQYVIYDEGRDNITGKTIRGMLMSPKLDMYLEKAAQIYNASSGNKSKKKAKKILRDVLMMICEDRQSAASLAAAGNKYMRQIEGKAQDISDNDPTAGQYVNQSSLNFDTTLNNFLSNQKEINRSRERERFEQKTREDLEKSVGGAGKLKNMKIEADLKKALEAWDKANPSSEKEEEVTSRIGLGGGNTKGGFNDFIKEMNQFSKGIYDILKSGVINVKIVTDTNPQNNNNQQRSKKKRRRRKKKTNNKGSSDDGGGDADVIEDVEDATEEEETTSSTMDDIASIVQARNEANPIQTFTNNFVSDVKSNGLVSTVKSRLNAGKEIVKDKYTNTKNTLKLESISDKVNAEGSKVSEMDKQRVQMVNTALQTAMQDGNGVEDKSKIRQLISNIDDQDLKQEMSKLADSVLTKESSDDEKGGKPKSLIGRLLGGIGGKLKSAFSFVLKPVTALLSTIGKGLKTYWEWTKKTWKSGLEDGKRGVGKIKNALFGGKSDKGSEEDTAEASSGEKKSSSGGSMMDDISSVKKTSSDLGGKSETTKNGEKTGGDKSGGKADGGGSKAKQLLSGGFDIASMVMKLVGPILAGMAGVEMLVKLVQGTLKKVLEPLNKLFKSLFKALSPILDTLTESLTPVIDMLTDVMINVITPMAPILQSIFECISPILDIVTVLLDAIMIPLQVTMETFIVPVLELVSGCLKTIVGILQLGFGSLMTPLGAILMAVGKIIPGGGKLSSKGKDIMSSGVDMVTSGGKMVGEGVKEAAIAAVKLTPAGKIANTAMTLIDMNSDEEGEEGKSESYQANVDVPTGGSAMDGIIGSGDVINNYYYQNMYGSGNNTYNQNSYHNGMNMSQHGCGPIALADRANRMGGGINPYSLTQAMMANGNYSPNAGTSVAGMISTGHALGMNLVPGGVTAASLRGASPNNPITVIGSGMGFGTRSGANHYVNVVGTDSAGGAYVSNPMTGRVGRVKANELVSNSKLGLYGSGDDISYKDVFGDKVASAFGELTNIWSSISNIFNFKDNETIAEKTKKKMDAEKAKSYINNVKSKYSDDEWQAKFDELAGSNPKNDGESDEDYQFRIDSLVADALATEYNKGSAFTDIKNAAGEFADKNALMIDSISKAGDEAEQKGSSNEGSSYGKKGGFYSSSGNVRLATDGYDVEYTDTDMSEPVGGHYIHSPIHEFFAKMGGKEFAESNNNWYGHYNDAHSKEGEGSAGDSHQGIDINIIGGIRGQTPVYATTDGILVRHQPEALADGGGNYVEWTDNDGMHHRIMHLDHFSEEMEAMNPGDKIVGGKTLLGYYGSTGNSTGDHIHYDISPNGYGSSEWYNPMTYFNFKPSATDGDSSSIVGDTPDEQMWQWLRYKGMKLPEASVAGIMGVWKAEGVRPKMIEGAYSEPETSLAEPIYDAIVGDPDDNEAGLKQLWDYTPEHAAGKNGGYLPNYMYDGHPWAGIGLAQWTAGRAYKLLKHAWEDRRKWYELLPQLQFFEKELQTTHTKAGNELLNGEGHTPEEMAQMFWTDFEGFTWGPESAYEKRRQNARNVYEQFKGVSEINPSNFGSINSLWDAYKAGKITYEEYLASGGTPIEGPTGEKLTKDGPIWVGNTSFKNIAGYIEWKKKQEEQADYNSFYINNLKNKYDKSATPNPNGTRSNYGGFSDIILRDYMKAIITPWSSYLDPDKNNYAGLYISHEGATIKPSHLSLTSYSNTGGDIDAFTDIRKNGMYDWDPKRFKKAVYSVMSDDSSLSEVKNYIDKLDEMRFNLPHTQSGAGSARTDHENMLYAYALDQLIGRSTPGYVSDGSTLVNTDHASLMKKFSDLSRTTAAPIAFQAYAGINSSDNYVNNFNLYRKGSAGNGSNVGIFDIPAIFSDKGNANLRKIRSAYGSGDEIATSIVDIPPIDYSKFTDEDWNNSIWNGMNSQTPTQQYVPTEDIAKNDQIDRILANEFKTSDKRTHDLLEKICDYLEKEKEERDGKPDPNSPNSTQQGSQDMFENEIPNSVYRLARG